MYTLDQKWHVFGQTNERYDRFTKASSGMFFGGSCTTISGIPSCIKTPEGKCEGERQYYYCYHTACCAHITKFSIYRQCYVLQSYLAIPDCINLKILVRYSKDPV